MTPDSSFRSSSTALILPSSIICRTPFLSVEEAQASALMCTARMGSLGCRGTTVIGMRQREEFPTLSVAVRATGPEGGAA